MIRIFFFENFYSSPSPKSPKSPIETDQNVANWMLYWSSRVEAEPPK
jgi:hypothetical protein